MDSAINYQNRQMTTSEIFAEIKKYKSMSELPIEAFAEEGQLADKFILDLNKNSRGINATQLRKFFHAIKKIQRQAQKEEKFDRSEVARLMPMLAYAVGRNELIPRDFYELMKLCFGSEKCTTKDDFLRAADFLEAVMAYHKFESR
jgi:CRISPR type III-A-associated protein Csm2